MNPEVVRITAVYEDGVLKPQGDRIANLLDGDRVEVVLVRAAPTAENAPEEVARRELITKAFAEYVEHLTTQPPEPDDDYDVLEAMNATRLRQGERPLVPPSGAR